MNEYTQSIMPLTKSTHSVSRQKKLLLLTQNEINTKMRPNPPKTFLRLQQCCMFSGIILADPTLAKISGDVMNMAISMSDCFSNVKGIIQAVRNIIYLYLCFFIRWESWGESWGESCGWGSYYYFLKFVKPDYNTRTSNWWTPSGTEILSVSQRYLPLHDLIFLLISQRQRNSSVVLQKVVLIKRFWEEIYFMFLKNPWRRQIFQHDYKFSTPVRPRDKKI